MKTTKGFKAGTDTRRWKHLFYVAARTIRAEGGHMSAGTFRVVRSQARKDFHTKPMD